jgi:hypothetical protein
VSTVKLSERETAALLALADNDTPLSGEAIGKAMRAARVIDSNAYGAHQSASGLVRKDLASKTIVDGPAGALIGYEITDTGRELAAQIRAAQ